MGREVVHSVLDEIGFFVLSFFVCVRASAARRRRRLIADVLGIIAIQVILWPFLPSWGARILTLGLTVLAAPVVWVLSFGRV